MCNKREAESIDEPLNGLNDELILNKSKNHKQNDQIKQSNLFFSLKNYLDKKLNCFETEIRWTHVIFMFTFHLISLHALYLLLTFNVKVQTILFAIFLHYLCNLGLTAGVHRLWSHKGNDQHKTTY